jgi:hypothetical protein
MKDLGRGGHTILRHADSGCVGVSKSLTFDEREGRGESQMAYNMLTSYMNLKKALNDLK